MKEVRGEKRLLCRGLDKPVLHLWSLRSSFPSALRLSSVAGHILRYYGSLQSQKIEVRDSEQRVQSHNADIVRGDWAMTKVSQRRSARKWHFQNRKTFRRIQMSKYQFSSFPKTLCHSASRPNKLKGHRGRPDLLNSWFSNISFRQYLPIRVVTRDDIQISYTHFFFLSPASL